MLPSRCASTKGEGASYPAMLRDMAPFCLLAGDKRLLEQHVIGGMDCAVDYCQGGFELAGDARNMRMLGESLQNGASRADEIYKVESLL